jgi:DNA-binding cell septation regulator SpoVG
MRKYTGLILGLALMFSAVSAFAEGEVYISNVKKVPAEGSGAVKEIATIVINDCLEIRDIGVVKMEGTKSLKYPVYVSKKGKEYPQFEVLTKQAKDEIEKAIYTGKPSQKTSKAITFKISKFSIFTRPSSLKAFASIDFNNSVRVECKVMTGRKGPWISWPSNKDEETGKYKKQILVTNKKVKDIVEKALLDKYGKMAKETSTEETE